MVKLSLEPGRWPLREPFVIARGTQLEAETLIVRIDGEDGHAGRGEACGIAYEHETPATMGAQIEEVRPLLEAAVDRQALLGILPRGGARNAVDAALWDLEAKRSGRSVFAHAGVPVPRPLDTVFSIGIRPIAAYERAARDRAAFKFLKVKVDASDPVTAVAAVRRGAPDARLIVDANQAWSIDQLKAFAPAMADLGVVLLEQPVRVGAEASLDGFRSPVPLCADESVNDASDLPMVRGRFDYINIKLDKCGGLTAALLLAQAARDDGLSLMVGCMGGSSLAMAPAFVLGQQCTYADLDGPLLQAGDWPDALTYRDGLVQPPVTALWG